MTDAETILRLRGDAHALATWLVLARSRIEEADSIFDDEFDDPEDRADAIKAWRERIANTVSVVSGQEITQRSGGHVFGPYFAVVNKDGTLRGTDDGDPYLFDRMGPHDNHTNHGRKVICVMLVEVP